MNKARDKIDYFERIIRIFSEKQHEIKFYAQKCYKI